MDLSEAVPIYINNAFRTLLESKHLYQSVSVGDAEVTKSTPDDIHNLWMIQTVLGRAASYGAATESYYVYFDLPTIITYCATCNNVWPHNPLDSNSKATDIGLPSKPPTQQIFCLFYECQGCKKGTVSYLVKREGLKLTLCGRSPMERVNVPKYIPKECRKYYEGAVLAYNSGQNLPALFMLRTTIEQFMRSQVEVTGMMTGDELAEAYASTLHDGFKGSFQSLKPIYETLSEAIHNAVSNDPALFEQERNKVLSHFESKEIFDRHLINK